MGWGCQKGDVSEPLPRADKSHGLIIRAAIKMLEADISDAKLFFFFVVIWLSKVQF